MRRIAATLAVVVTLLFSAGSAWADWNDGWAAYERGDYATALQEWRPLAEQGHAKAQYFLAAMYAYGTGVSRNVTEAVKWYRKAAEQSNPDAQGNLGVMYGDGDGILKDLSKAKYWIKKAYDNPDAKTRVVENAEKNWNRLELWKYWLNDVQ